MDKIEITEQDRNNIQTWIAQEKNKECFNKLSKFILDNDINALKDVKKEKEWRDK